MVDKFGNKTGGRVKKVPEKLKARVLLHKLERDYDFVIVEKILDLYNEIEKSAKNLVIRAIDNAEHNLSPTTGFTDDEIDYLKESQAKRWTILEKFLSYCYPKLRSVELNQGSDHDKIIFNISTGSDMKIEGKRG